MTAGLLIAEGLQITLHFSLSLPSGEVIDSNFDATPATFCYGDGNMLPGFEACLLGLPAGTRQRFEIPPEQGFGQRKAANIRQVSRGSFDPAIDLMEGLVVSFADPAGGELPGVVRAFDDASVEVDFNHPLAGHTIIFDVEILAVQPPLTH